MSNLNTLVKTQQCLMFALKTLVLFAIVVHCYGNWSEEEPVLYYYGIEESERGLPECSARQACSVLLKRYWRADALVRLCRCARRLHCDTHAPSDHRIELNNHAYFQFCQPVTEWPLCVEAETSLKIESHYDRLNPDELEVQHHKNLQLIPPKITFNCLCRTPNYWRLSSIPTNHPALQNYRCASLPICRTGELCGTVSNDLFALYQSCLCPKNHICVHSGGIPYLQISEVMYNGLGWRAHCVKIADENSNEDY